MARFTLPCLVLVLAISAAFVEANKKKGGHHCRRGSMCHDPILIGFNNHRFEFHGKPGLTYNILSTQDLQVNAEMIDLKVFKELGPKATFLGSIAVMHNNDRVVVRAGFGDRVEATVNGITLELNDLKGSSQVATPDGSIIKLYSRTSTAPDTVQIATPKLSLTLMGGGHHLNMAINRVVGGLCEVHGVLGQTYTGAEIAGVDLEEEPKSEGFKPVGQDEDYLVTGLLSVDSKYNRFGVEPTGCKDPAPLQSLPGAARRLMRALTSSGMDCAAAGRLGRAAGCMCPVGSMGVCK